MTEKNYAKREIDNFMEQMKSSLLEFRKDVEMRDTAQRAEIQSGFGAITTRQDTQNGRISKLERWQYTMMGALSILTVIVVPILGWALYILVNIQTQVNEAVATAISSYDVKVK